MILFKETNVKDVNGNSFKIEGSFFNFDFYLKIRSCKKHRAISIQHAAQIMMSKSIEFGNEPKLAVKYLNSALWPDLLADLGYHIELSEDDFIVKNITFAA